MLTQKDLDRLMQEVQKNGYATIYYVAHMIEGRETDTLDEHAYKSISQFKIVKLKLTGMRNAYFEYVEYAKCSELEKQEKYHTETEECYYCPTGRYVYPGSIMDHKFLIPVEYEPGPAYIHHYITKNTEGDFTKDFNSRIPSIIYGYTRVVKTTEGETTITDPSPVKAIWTNAILYEGKKEAEAEEAFNKGELDWKYKLAVDCRLEEEDEDNEDNIEIKDTVNVDGIEYKYVTSDWYILDIENFPMIEKPLIVAGRRSGYFMTIADACYYIDQLIA